MKFNELPGDMQNLVVRYAQAVNPSATIPANLPTITLNLADLPVVPLDEYDRGTLHARRMKPDQVPPILVAHNQFLDGKHRRHCFDEQGLDSIAAIDLTHLISPSVALSNSYGELGAGIVLERDELYPDFKQYHVWDYAQQSFVGKHERHTLMLNEADLLSRNEINERYSDPAQYLIYMPDSVHDIEVQLVIEPRERGWAWRYETQDFEVTDWQVLPYEDDCHSAARAYALGQMLYSWTPNPYLFMAAQLPHVRQEMALDSGKAAAKVKPTASEYQFEW